MFSKLSNFGGAVDIASRQRGAEDALKQIGLTGAAPELKDIGKTRLGAKPESPPKAQTQPAHKYTTSGALTNPKVAAMADAPNYGPAASKNTNCEKCAAYDKQDSVMGHCAKYDFYANGSYTCDGWKPKNGPSPSHFIRTKIR